MFHNLLYYGNEYIEKLSVDEDSSINEKINLIEEYDVSDDGKQLNSLKNIRRNDQTSINRWIK